MASEISHIKTRKRRGFMSLLSSAACEWLLMFLLFINAAFSYLLAKFAKYCDLQKPCVLCSRLDHIFGHEQRGCYWSLLCPQHIEEISSMASCSIHAKLADIQSMCEECLMPIAMQNKSNTESYRMLVGKVWVDIEKSALQNLMLNKNIRLGPSIRRNCSCCNKSWKTKSNAERLLEIDHGFCGSKANIKPPLPRVPGRSRFSRRNSFNRLRDSFIGPIAHHTSGCKSVDTLSMVDYTRVKISSDSESDVAFSGDEEDEILATQRRNSSKLDYFSEDLGGSQLRKKMINKPTSKMPAYEASERAFSRFDEANLIDLSEHKALKLKSLERDSSAEKSSPRNFDLAESQAKSTPDPSFTPELISLDYVSEPSDVGKIQNPMSDPSVLHMTNLSILSELLSLSGSSSLNYTVPAVQESNDYTETNSKKNKSETEANHTMAVAESPSDGVHPSMCESCKPLSEGNKEKSYAPKELNETSSTDPSTLNNEPRERSGKLVDAEPVTANVPENAKKEAHLVPQIRSSEVVPSSRETFNGNPIEASELQRSGDSTASISENSQQDIKPLPQILTSDRSSKVTSNEAHVQADKSQRSEYPTDNVFANTGDTMFPPQISKVKSSEAHFQADESQRSDDSSTNVFEIAEEAIKLPPQCSKDKSNETHLQADTSQRSEDSTANAFANNEGDTRFPPQISKVKCSEAPRRSDDSTANVFEITEEDIKSPPQSSKDKSNETHPQADASQRYATAMASSTNQKDIKPLPRVRVSEKSQSSTDKSRVQAKDLPRSENSTPRVRLISSPPVRKSSSYESFDKINVGEIEGGDIVQQLKQQVEHDRSQVNSLCKKLEEERNAALFAANEAKALLAKLQEDKAIQQVQDSEHGPSSKDTSKVQHDEVRKSEDSTTNTLLIQSLLNRNSSSYESLDRMSIGEIEGEDIVELLKQQVEHDRRRIDSLYKELEEERNASTIAANEAMAMITKLQEEKAALHMEALQYLRMMEEQAEYDMEALQRANELLAEKEKEMQDMEEELDFYRTNLAEGTLVADPNVNIGDLEEKSHVKVIQQPPNSPAFSDLNPKVNGNSSLRKSGSLMNFEDEKHYITECLMKLERRLHHHGHSHDMPNSPSSGNMSKVDKSEPNKENGVLGENHGKDGETKMDSFEKEIARLHERLEALEADEVFLKHAFNSLHDEQDGVQFIKEIAQQLQELRKIELEKT